MNKKTLALFLAFLLSLNLTACKSNDISREEIQEDEKGFEEFLKKEELSKFKDEILEIVDSMSSGFETRFDEFKNEVTSKIEDLKEEVKDEIKQELKEELSSSEENRYQTVDVHSYSYVNTDSVVYENVEMNGEVGYVSTYQKVYRIMDFDNGSSLVEYYVEDKNFVGFISTSNLTDLPNIFVEVDLTTQTVRLIKDDEILYENSIVSGKPSSPTRVGYFNIDSRETNRYLTGPGYRSYVNYWMPFDGDIGLHDADGWRTIDEYGGDTHLSNGLHGCVNMPNEAAKYIYENVKTGDMVLVHK